MQRLWIAVLAVVIGGGVGFAAGRYSILYYNPAIAIELPDEPPPSPLTGASRVIDALLIPDQFERVEALLELSRLSPAETGDVNRALRTAAVDRDLVEAILLVRMWARHQPVAALNWAFTKPGESFKVPLVSAAIEEWARRDPQAAAKGLDERTQRLAGDLTESAEKALMRGWVDSGDYTGVEEYLRGRGVSFDRQRQINAFARRLVQRAGAQAAIDWAEALNEEEWRFKLAAWRQTATEIAKLDPAAARAWCERVCGTRYAESMERQIANGWLVADGQAALEWLSGMEAGSERDNAVLQTYRYWWQLDKNGEARRWIEGVGLENVEEWMYPIMQLWGPSLALEDPAQAVKWAMKAPEGPRRNQALIAVNRRWRNRDEAAAEAWLQSSPLSEPDRARAREGLQAGRGRKKAS